MIGVALLIAQLPTDIIYKLDEKTHYYTTGIGYYFLIAISVFYIGASMLQLRSKVATKANKIVISVFAIVTVLSLGTKYLFSNVLTELFVQSLLLLMIVVSLEDSSKYYDQTRKVYNYYGFENDISVLFKRNNPLSSLIVIKNPEMAAVTTRYGKIVTAELLETMLDGIRQIAPDATIYDLENGKFVIAHVDFDANGIADEYKAIKARFEKEWDVNKHIINIKSNVVLINIPEDLHQEEQLIQFVEKYEGFETIVDVKRSVAVEKAILNAIINNGFFVVYQPLLNMSNGIYDRAEALVRLVDEELGYISPDEFVRVAEQNGVMLDLGDIVLNKVMDFISKNDLQLLGIKKININLSPIQCSSLGFSEHLAELIEFYGIDPSLLCFEVTETMAFHDANALTRLIDDLHAMNSSIALDDFGSGYSNIVNVFSVDYDEIKIDKSLLWNANEYNHGDAILKETINMIKEVKKEVVVEGVETNDQLKKLTELGCNYCQGFIFSKPIKEDEFISFLRRKLD
jgi:EAL domain-containing protein (putative c-di-GMP-specific phosphodiesterase class I)